MGKILIICILGLSPLLADAAQDLTGMDIVELTNLNDKCVTARLNIMSAQIRAQAEIIDNAGFLAGFSRESAARLINSVANGTEKLSQTLASNLYTICLFVQKEVYRRLSE